MATTIVMPAAEGRQITIELTADQVASIEQYCASQVRWQYDDAIKANRPYPIWNSAEEWIDYVIAQALQGPMAMHPPAAVQAAQEQIAQLQSTITTASKATRLTASQPIIAKA